MQIIRAGVIYFAFVFGAGFVLGSIRILWVVPRLGTRIAELLEAPIMFVVIIFAAQRVVRRLRLAPSPATRLGMGCLGLAFMLIAEFALVLWLWGISVSEYLATRDPVSGTPFLRKQSLSRTRYGESNPAPSEISRHPGLRLSPE